MHVSGALEGIEVPVTNPCDTGRTCKLFIRKLEVGFEPITTEVGTEGDAPYQP